ncbi:MAG: PF20097 family protein [Ruminococcus sp.]|nr:PF20097 family protein [Ruminococcus sp.]
MTCPFCGGDMRKGVISGDGRSGVYFKEGEKKAAFTDKLGDKGKLTAVKYSLAVFEIEAFFCGKCRKMVFDTELS